MSELNSIQCKQCKGTGIQPAHKQKDNKCIWCGGSGAHYNIPYPMFCLHPSKCASKSSCPLSYSCCE